MPEIPENRDDLQVTSIKMSDDSRKPVAVSLGCHLEGAAMPHADPNDTETMLAGCFKRLGAKIPTVDDGMMKKLHAFVIKHLDEHMPTLSPDVEISYEKWRRTTTYPEWRKKELDVQYEQLLIHGLREEDFFCNSFGKDEFYEEYKHQRLINSRSDRFKVFAGPWIRAVEEVVYKDPWFIKHVPVDRRPQYLTDRLGPGHRYFFGTDYSSFECSIIKKLLGVEFLLYKHVLRWIMNSKWFIDEYSKIKNTNKLRFFLFIIKMLGIRMSGEMSTSLGNGFINKMVVLFLCELRNIKVTGCVEGDDGIFSTSNDEFPTVEDFAKLGLNVKIQMSDTLGDTSFCGLIFAKEDMINITDPRAELATFGWANQKYLRSSNKKLKALLRCKSLSMIHQYPGCPILQELALYGLRITEDVSNGKLLKVIKEQSTWIRDQGLKAFNDIKNLPYKATPSATRELMERRFGITVQQQIKIERLLKAKNDLTPINLNNVITMPEIWIDYWEKYSVHGNVADPWPIPTLRRKRLKPPG